MIARLRFFWNDRSAAVAPMVAVLGATLICAAALALDAGVYYAEDRALQGATEAAALSAAIDPYDALSRARSYLQQNGYPATVIRSIEVGRYCADSSLAPGARFFPSGAENPCPGNGRLTAVRLKTRKASKRYLSAVFGEASPIPDASAAATAARVDEAGLQMTSGALTLDTGVVNQLLTALTGKNIALTLLQFQALMGSNIDAGVFLDRLASRTGQTGTYASILTNPAPFATVIGAAADAAAMGGNIAVRDALTALQTQGAGSPAVSLAGLVDLGIWEKIPAGNATGPASLRAGLNAYQLIAYALQTNGRSTTVNGLNVGVAGITSVQLVGAVSGTLSRPRFGYGPENETSAYTAITRLHLSVRVANLGALLKLPLVNGLGVDIPLVIEIGQGSASITGISCGTEAATDSRVAVQAQSGLLSAYIGKPPADLLTQPFRPLSANDFDPVILADLLLIKLTLKGAVGPILGTGPRTLSFTRQGSAGLIGDPRSGSAGTPIRIGNGSQLAPLLSSLGSNLQLDARVPLLGIYVPAGDIVSAATPLLFGAISALGTDPLIDALLNGLGVQAGYADSWVTGVRCGVPVLV